jgi:protein gp37
MPIINELTQRGWTTFISAEPLLERLDLGFDKGYRVHQVITGAESGKKSKDGTGRKIQSMDEDWVRALRDQCVDANVAFFYKQNFLKGKKVHLPLLDGRQWVEFPVMQKDNNYLKGKI